MKPLMPTTPERARHLLDQGKASAYWNKLGIFCIILKKEVEADNQQIAVGIDVGSSFEGWSIVGARDTILNGMSEAPMHIKKSMEVRRFARKSRRHRKCWRREARFNNRNRNQKSLPPSTFARWNAKIRILVQLMKVLPITDVVVEDVGAIKIYNCKKWNRNFSQIEVGKKWFYNTIEDLGLNLQLRKGYDTKKLRDKFNLDKSKNKAEKTFNSHAVDAWVMAASVTGATRPTWFGLFYWIPIRYYRRQLHRLQPAKGGIRNNYGGTRSLGLTKRTLVIHPKHGLVYIGGTYMNKRLFLHDPKNGHIVSRRAKVEDCRILTKIVWRRLIL
jgi:hypothetical protein